MIQWFNFKHGNYKLFELCILLELLELLDFLLLQQLRLSCAKLGN